MNDETIQLINKPLRRLKELYWIKTEDEGRSVPFRPRDEQWQVIRSLVQEPNIPLYIIKSRRLGMSTAIGLTMADAALWNVGMQASLVDQTEAAAERKMAEIIRYGVYSVPPEFVQHLNFKKENDGELQILVKGEDAGKGSRIFAGKSARGGTNNFLWISEWGPIAALDPKRSREIRTGALPSARRGRRVVETTWYGGKGGDLWELIKPILERDPNAAGRVLFFPWHGDPACVKLTGHVDGQLEEYFRELGEKTGSTFTQEQKRWYAATKLEQGIFVKREYPSTLEEAMTAPVEGSIYGAEVTELQAKGAIGPLNVDKSALVHTFWDLGSPQNTVTWYLQMVADDVRVIDVDFSTKDAPQDFTLVERVAHMLAKGYPFGYHFFPHDAMQTDRTGRTVMTELAKCGLKNVRVVPRTHDIWVGINRLKQIFPRLRFRLPQCEHALDALQNYHTRTQSTGTLMDEPVHDWSSHAADALRTFAEAEMAGMIKVSMAPPKPRMPGSRREEVRMAFGERR